MARTYIDYDFLIKDVLDAIIHKFEYPLDYEALIKYFLDLKYGDIKVIDTIVHGEDMYINPNCHDRIDSILERLKIFYEESKSDFESATNEKLDEEDLEFYHNEMLKWEQIINILKMINTTKFSTPKFNDYLFVALPRKEGCSLDDSDCFGTSDMQNALNNLENMEKLIASSMDLKNMVVTRQKATGLHKVGSHTMYKNVGNNQRILFKQCENNENVFFVLVVNCNVHGNDQKDDARNRKYDELTEELKDFLDNYRKDGKVVFSKDDLKKLVENYISYKQSLASKIMKNKSDIKLTSLNKLVKKIVESIKNKEKNSGDIFE